MFEWLCFCCVFLSGIYFPFKIHGTILTEVSSEEATHITSTRRRMTIPRAIRLRWVYELLWELIRFMIKTHTICNLFKIDKGIKPKRLQMVTKTKGKKTVVASVSYIWNAPNMPGNTCLYLLKSRSIKDLSWDFQRQQVQLEVSPDFWRIYQLFYHWNKQK